MSTKSHRRCLGVTDGVLGAVAFFLVVACQSSGAGMRNDGANDASDEGGNGGSGNVGVDSGGNAAGSGGKAAGSGGSPTGSGGNPVGSGGNTAGIAGTAGSGGNVVGTGGNVAGSGGNASAAGNSGTPNSPAAAWWSGGPRTKARVFFSGHSLMDNPIPNFVVEIAQSLGHDLQFNEQIKIGSPIRDRTGEPPQWGGYRTGKNREGSGMNVIEELKNPKTLGAGEKYDVLLITERHDILGTIEWEDTMRGLRHFHDRLIAGSPTATTIFTQTWLDIDKDNPSVWINHEKTANHAWECVANKVNHTLAAEGRNDRVVAQPGGAALVSLVEKVIAGQVQGISGSVPDRLNALFRDNVHPTRLGAYFIAAVHYATIFRRSPVGAAVPADVPAAPVPDLQRIAWEFVNEYYSRPKAAEHTMAECRKVISETICQTFWTLQKREGQISDCKKLFADEAAPRNPFRWPDSTLMLLPAP